MTPRREDLLAAEIAGRLAGCPTGEELQRFGEDSLAREARMAISGHAGGCEACSAGLAFLEQIRDGASSPSVELPPALERRSEALIGLSTELGPRSGLRPRPALFVGATLALATAALIMAVLWLAPTSPETATPIAEDVPLRPIEPQGTVAAVPSALRWTPDPRASRYRVVLSGGGPPRTMETRDAVPMLDLDDRAVARLRAGVEYAWSVTTIGPDGQEIEGSAPARFRIAARSR